LEFFGTKQKSHQERDLKVELIIGITKTKLFGGAEEDCCRFSMTILKSP